MRETRGRVEPCPYDAQDDIHGTMLAVSPCGGLGRFRAGDATPIAPFNESYADPTGDASAGVPDVTGVTAANDIRGLLTFV